MDLNAWNFQNEISLISDFITTGDQLGGVRAVGKAKITVNGIITVCTVGRNFLIR